MFSPLAWLKLQYFCHAGPTEVGGYGISRRDDLLYIDDFVTVPQDVSPVTVRFRDEGVADHYDRFIDKEYQLQSFSRVWLHTHPGSSAEPSGTDEDTFARCFGTCDWAIMAILSRTSQSYVRLNFGVGPGGGKTLNTIVDWSAWPGLLGPSSNALADLVRSWHDEYVANVHVMPEPVKLFPDKVGDASGPRDWDGHPYCHELDEIFFEPAEESGHGYPFF